MAKKGNGIDLANDYLRQIVDLTTKQNEKLDFVVREVAGVKLEVAGVKREVGTLKEEIVGVKQEMVGVKQELVGVKKELSEHSMRLVAIEFGVRQIASFVGQEFQDIKRRVEILESKAA